MPLASPGGVDLIGTHFGSYVATKQLGAGGAGTVYLCEHTMIDRKVAVKVLHDELAGDPDQVERFFQEARAAAAIGHANIITIIDVGYVDTPAGKRVYMMMEALDGLSLEKQLRLGGLSLEQIRHILEQCASALAASHGKGIVHRDLKPANIHLCPRPFDPMFVKVLDFGIAKLTTPGTARKTRFGTVLGTPHYMSPEQCDGQGAIDHRSDIYSLGCVLYEMLTGTLPFDGDVGEILIAHIRDDVEPPSRRNPGIPPEWEALCLHMLERAKEDRPQTMAEVVDALGDLPGHVMGYAAERARRAAARRPGHSGHTLIATAPDLDEERPSRPAPAIDSGSRPTPPGGSPAPTGGFDAPPPVIAAPPVIDFAEVAAHCGELATERRHRRFIDMLIHKPRGHWVDVRALCRDAERPPPPGDAEIDVAWLDPPHAEPGQISVAFFAPASLWSVVLVHIRPD